MEYRPQFGLLLGLLQSKPIDKGLSPVQKQIAADQRVDEMRQANGSKLDPLTAWILRGGRSPIKKRNHRETDEVKGK